MFPYKIYYINTFSSYYFYFVVERLYFVDAYHSYCSSKALALAGQGLPRSLTLIIDGDHFGWVALLAASHGHHCHQPPNTAHITQLQHLAKPSVSLKFSRYVQKVVNCSFFRGDFSHMLKSSPLRPFCSNKVGNQCCFTINLGPKINNSCIRISHHFIFCHISIALRNQDASHASELKSTMHTPCILSIPNKK